MKASVVSEEAVSLESRRISIQGVVQGVGFRPFVHNLATSMDLRGYVLNSTHGVVIEIEASSAQVLNGFVERLRRELPPLAHIDKMEVFPSEPKGFEDFSIRESLDKDGQYVLISPDVATCSDCLREIRDPGNRRYGYPFINCTNCGPRYTIIKDIPYDRPKTTMSVFSMCGVCRREYEDPSDRRFHAQPIACADCGPSLRLVPSSESSGGVPEILEGHKILQEVRKLLTEGRVVAIRGLGGFHIACDATNHEAVSRLREAKRRSNKPFAVMCRDLDVVRKYACASPAEEAILQSSRRPICLISLREGITRLSPLVAPRNRYLGVMLPYTPLHELLFQDGLEILVMTSGNWSEEPIIAANGDALERLDPLVDAFLLHDRGIFTRIDDSVVRAFDGEERVIRRARGFVPTPIYLGRSVPEILACGGELKHTFCLTKDRFAIMSQHIGDLENLESMEFFMKTLENLKVMYRVNPEVIAYDLHPGYLSTQWAETVDGVERVGVQHHHAHIVSCMAEHQLEGRAIGVAFDGTGYGEDGALWGGEFLVANRRGFKRAAHLKYLPLPGGEGAIKEPWRMTMSHLINAFGELPELGEWSPGADERRIADVFQIIQRRVHSPPTSSIGRLFDAVSSLLGIRHQITFEGEAAINLEMISDPEEQDFYRFEFQLGETIVIDPAQVIRHLWGDYSSGVPFPILGGRFHRSVAMMVSEICREIRDRERLNRICLSGGVFQNLLLLRHTVDILRDNGFEVYVHKKVSPNDGGISLGQAVVAAAIAGG